MLACVQSHVISSHRRLSKMFAPCLIYSLRRLQHRLAAAVTIRSYKNRKSGRRDVSCAAYTLVAPSEVTCTLGICRASRAGS